MELIAQKPKLPRAASALIVSSAVAGTAIVAWRLQQLASWRLVDLLAWAALVVAGVALEQFPMSYQHGDEKEIFSLTDVVWVAGLVLVRPDVLTLAVGTGTLLGQSLNRVARHKVAFNAGQDLIGITIAILVERALLPAAPALTDPAVWGAAIAGMACYFAVNESMIAQIISVVEARPFREIVFPTLGLSVLQWAGNVLIGLLAALVWSEAKIGLPLLVAPVSLSYLGYRAWLSGIRESDRMRGLYEAGKALSGPLGSTPDYREFLRAAADLLEAAAVELVAVEDGRVTVHGSDGRTAFTPEGDHPGDGSPRAYVPARPGLELELAAVASPAGVQTFLAVYRDRTLSRSERSLLDALASQASVKLENGRLFLEILEQRTQLGDIVANTSDGIFTVSPDHRILSWNPGMARITGFAPEEATGRRVEHVLGTTLDGTAGPEAAVRVIALEPAIGQIGDAEVVRKDGTRRWIRYTRNAVRDREGEVRAEVVVARDVTAELEVERAKAEFVAAVSHELRTPLTPLKGYLTSLARGAIPDSPQARQEYYEIMLNQANRLERLITDLLDVSQIESGQMSIAVESVDIGDLLDAQAFELSRQHPDRDVRFHRPARPVVVQADPFRVGQVALNLLSNALKYSPAGSPVDLELACSGSHAVVSVGDRGPGVPAPERDRVFERFHRVENGLTRTTGGTGLGLFIARRLVEGMFGRLWLEPRAGGGSTFSFSLPLVVASGSPSNDSPPNGHGSAVPAMAAMGAQAPIGNE